MHETVTSRRLRIINLRVSKHFRTSGTSMSRSMTNKANACEECKHIAEAYFYEEIAKGLGYFAANEWLSTIRKNRRRESKLNRPKFSPSDRCAHDLKSEQSFPRYARPSHKISQSTWDNTTSSKREVRDFSELVLTSDTLPTPIEIFTLGGRTGKESKNAPFMENFGLLYTDAAHVFLCETDPKR